MDLRIQMTKTWIRTLAAILATAALTASCGGEEENPNLANVQLEQLLVKPIPSRLHPRLQVVIVHWARVNP